MAGAPEARAEGGDVQALLDAYPDPAWIFDKATRRFLAVNLAAIHRYGWTREEFLALSLEDIRPEAERGTFLSYLSGYPPSRISNGEWHHRSKDGTEFLVDVSARDIRFSGRDCRFVIAQDAFERRMAWMALRETQETYSGLVENLSEGVAILDEEGRFLWVNSACGRVFGVDPDALLGRRTVEYLAEGSVETHRAQLRRPSGGQGDPAELEILRADGARRWLSVRTAPRMDASGGFAGTVASFFDITPHRRALEALQQSEARFRRLVEMLPQGLVTYQDGLITYSNPAAAAITRSDPAQTAGKPVLDFIHPQHWPAIQERLARMLAGEALPPADYTFLRGDGTEVQVEAQAMILEGGEHPVMVSVFTDLTRRLEMEEAIRESEARYRSVIEQAQDMIFVVDLEDLSVVQANQAFHRALGYGEGALPLNLRALIDADEGSIARNTVRVRAEGRASIGRRRYRHAGGGTVDVEVSASLLHHGDRDLMVVLARDITERLATEQALQQAQRLESLGVLAGGIAHDFNNLLTAMMGNLSLAQLKSHPSSPAWGYLDALEKSLQRATDLTRQMLAYSGKGKFVTRLLDLNQAVEEMTHLLSVSISKRIALRFDLAPGLPPLEADPGQLQQVVMNLVINAADAIGDAEGVIRISTRLSAVDEETAAREFPAQALQPGPCLVLEVSDTGCGMDEATQRRVFEPFFTTKPKGRGLGLSAMQGILRGHKGGIRIESAPGRGTTFRIHLPAKVGARIEEAPGQAGAPLRLSGSVLVVDDEPEIRRSAVELFQALGAQSVVEATDGAEALAAFRARRGEIALVFMDLTMPRMNGLEAFRAMRAEAPDLPVILTSGFNEEAGFEGEGRPSAFLQKPYRFRQLQSVVMEVLRGGA